MLLTFWLAIEAQWQAVLVVRFLCEQLRLRPSAMRRGHLAALVSLAWSSVIDLAHAPSHLPSGSSSISWPLPAPATRRSTADSIDLEVLLWIRTVASQAMLLLSFLLQH